MIARDAAAPAVEGGGSEVDTGAPLDFDGAARELDSGAPLDLDTGVAGDPGDGEPGVLGDAA